MIQAEELEKRLQDLDWTLYRLAKEVAELRATRTREDVLPPSRYHTTLSKAIKTPSTSKLETIEDIVKVLNGELMIFWEADQVVSIRLEEQTMEALKEKAQNEGKTINELAKQLLLQALSGIPYQTPYNLTELVIEQEPKIYRSFHPLISSAYDAVHQWLEERPEAKGYKELDYEQDIKRSLKQTNLKSVAFQFYTLFPRYYFQSAHILESIINQSDILRGLKYNPRIFLIDVGCVMGAATAAFIERILILQKEANISDTIEIVCLGIDPSIDGIAVYTKLMQEIKKLVSIFNINLEFQPICERGSQGIITALSYLKSKLKTCKIPVLSKLFLMQLDLASSISQEQILRKEQAEKLRNLGLEIEPELILDTEKEFWQEEALAYKQLLETVPVEHLHIMTIGTKHLEENLKKLNNINESIQGIQLMNKSINEIFKESHPIISLEQEQEVNFQNPIHSYWVVKDQQSYSSKFYASFQTISNQELKTDNEWGNLLSMKNLELAWVEARKNLLNASLYDEIELRIFENNLQENIQIILDKLIFYSEDIMPVNQEINYAFIKGASKSRPKQLSRLEEEIIATALVQTIGKDRMQKFYSYSIQKEPTEDLYEYYFEGYSKYLKDAQASAEISQAQGGAVIRTDIKSYYTKIIQEQLIEITIQELAITSKRIKWLLSEILSKDLYGHEKNKGIKQGTLTSGFYQNLYLSSIDKYFITSEKWRNIVGFYRYVDDMIITTRHQDYISDVESDLKQKLEELELELNQDKTENYNCEEISEFIETIQLDSDLKILTKEFNYLLSKLWRMDKNYRTLFAANIKDNDHLWWHLIKLYQQCLYSINIYILDTSLSRKIYQYLTRANNREYKDLKLPNFINNNNFLSVYKWFENFKTLNYGWMAKKDELKSKINNLFFDSIKEQAKVVDQIKQIDNPNEENKKEKRKLIAQQKRLESRIRFAIPKLSILGFDTVRVRQELIKLLCNKDLFVIRNLDVIIDLARQGYTEEIRELTKFYQNGEENTHQYIRAIILEALRFLPALDSSDWQLIFTSSLLTDKTKIIEPLKATETWLYLRDIAKYHVQRKHLEGIITSLNNDPPPRLKKNYILILGLYDSSALSKVTLSKEEENDYLIKDAYDIAIKGKVSELFKDIEPRIIRQYYNTKQYSVGKEQQTYSL